MGNGTETECEFKIQTIKMNDKIVKIVCGANHTIIQLLNDEIHGFGWNFNAQIGTGDTIDVLSPKLLMKEGIKKIVCGSTHTIYLTIDGESLGCGYNRNGQLSFENKENVVLLPTLIMNDIEIKDIFCGIAHTLILKNNGELFGFGNNIFGKF